MQDAQNLLRILQIENIIQCNEEQKSICITCKSNDSQTYLTCVSYKGAHIWNVNSCNKIYYQQNNDQ